MNDIFLAEESCGPKHQKFITICDQCVKGTCLQFYFNLVIQEYILIKIHICTIAGQMLEAR